MKRWWAQIVFMLRLIGEKFLACELHSISNSCCCCCCCMERKVHWRFAIHTTHNKQHTTLHNTRNCDESCLDEPQDNQMSRSKQLAAATQSPSPSPDGRWNWKCLLRRLGDPIWSFTWSFTSWGLRLTKVLGLLQNGECHTDWRQTSLWSHDQLRKGGAEIKLKKASL